MLFDHDGRFVYTSPSHRQMLGIDPATLISKNIRGLFHPDDLAAIDHDMAAFVTSGGGPDHTIIRVSHADGSWRWLEVSVAPMQWQGAKYVVGVGRDVTERMQAEEQLRAAEARYRTLIEQLPVIVYTADLDTMSSTRYVSPQVEAILGFTPDEWLADPQLWLKQIHPDDQPRILDEVEAAQASGTPVPGEFRSFTRDGRLVWLQDAACIVRDDAGQALFMQGVTLDITQRKQAEEALRRSEGLYRTLAHNFPNGAVMLFDRDLRHILVDGSGLADMGLTREQVEDRRLVEAFPPEISAAFEPMYHAALDGRPGVTELQLADHTYAVHALPLRDERGAISGGMVMIQDVTDHKRIEKTLTEERALLAQRVAERTAALSAANAELARAVRLKDEFLASMSHELRTPLNAVLGLSEALREAAYGELNEDQDRALATIVESGQHLLELINDILDLAKIGAGKLELEIEPVELAMIYQASLRLVKQTALKKRITIEAALDPAVRTLHADGRRLKQILVNLLSNAVKFTPAGGRVGLEVRGDAARHTVELTVWDTGIGIAPEQMVRLFQPFVQIDSRLARQYEGTGLGLSLVYRMVEMHGGSVAVSSQPGQGSRFTVSLPWAAVEIGPAVEGQPAGQAASPRDTCAQNEAQLIMLAEDNETNIAMLSDYLISIGYQVIVARNGVEAVARAQERQPDLILMDIQMPGMDGLEATRRIRADAGLGATPIIALTALAMPGDREKCMAAGMNEYMSKPISLKQLALTMQRLLGSCETRPA
jgi:PAS domain S-box-containing protein